MLVSHWPVASNATVELITGTFIQLKNNPYLTRNEALRLSRIELIKNKNNDYSHPYFWAPFVNVGFDGLLTNIQFD